MPYEPENGARGDRRRRRLLELGLELFGSRSYADISIDDIAAAAKISRGLLYHYFSNKRGFYVESIRFAAVRLLERIEPAPDQAPEDRLREGLRNYLAYVGEFGTAYTTLLRGGLGYDPTVAEILEHTRGVIVGRILHDLGPDLGPDVGPDPGRGLDVAANGFRLAVRAWIGMVETASMDWLERREISRDELIELLVAGLRGVLEGTAARAYGQQRERWPITLR